MSDTPKVFMDSQGRKYLSQSAKSPSDMHIPHVSPALLVELSAESMIGVKLPEGIVKKVIIPTPNILGPAVSPNAEKLAAIKAHQQAVQKEAVTRSHLPPLNSEKFEDFHNEIPKNKEIK